MGTYNSIKKPIFWRLRSGERIFLLLIVDFTIACLSLFIALYVWAAQDQWLTFSLQFLRERPPFWYYSMPFIWILLLIEIYDLRRASRRNETISGIAIAAGISFMMYMIVYFTSTPNSLPRQGVALFILISFITTLVWRLLYINIFTAPVFMRRVLIIGAGRSGTTLAKIVKEIWPPPFFLIGLIDDNPKKIGRTVSGFKIMGGCECLLDIIEEENVTDLVFAISNEMSPEMFQSLLVAEEKGIEVATMAKSYEELLGRVPISLLKSDWILRSFVDQVHASSLYEMAKRLVDIFGATVGLCILLPLFPLIALAIYVDSGRPALYIQRRLGKNGRIYEIIKFRTMRQDAEKDGKARPAVENDERVTKVGRFLRKSHLDEFPQFINVIRGDMSLVGPRAERIELVDELHTKVPFYRARLLIKPGLTGWAQINFGYASTVEETATKLEYDLYYIKHRTLVMDFIILLRTLGTVLGFRGQ